jgi:hypothetical protein
MNDSALPDSPEISPADRRPARERLRDDVEAKYDMLIGSIFDAIEATKTVSTKCGHCGRSTSVAFPDIRARLDASRLLLDQGYGRPSEAPKPVPGSDIPEGARAEVRKALLGLALGRVSPSSQ